MRSTWIKYLHETDESLICNGSDKTSHIMSVTPFISLREDAVDLLSPIQSSQLPYHF